MAKVALVTGGARGIGRAIALNLMQDHDVAVTWRATAPDGLPDQITAIETDLARDHGPADVIATVIERFGRLDVLVNNAGVIGPSPIDDYDPDAYRAVLDVNLLAPHGLLAAALPHLEPGAVVINISSVNAVLPPKEAVIYGASKAALDLWTRGVAKELGPRGIRVNAVAPGAINTPEKTRSPELTQLFVDMTALGRMGEPEDIAKAVRFLASDEAGFITGEVLTVSGGYRL